ncbi:MAG: YgeY family selenium metabolism-linked hydrolase [Candidatus Cloacimonetes bacterium]|nr:YgeY family selenium metabolism-linked hydrolase [Candidatus Cloacimonadota bacterium]
MYKEIRDKAFQYEADTVGYLADMISIPSYSTKEAEVISYIRQVMESLQFDDVRVDGLGNVIGKIGNGSRSIAFDAHIDTVYAGNLDLWLSDPFAPVVKDGMIIGRGSVDQKSGMASMLTAARIIKDLGLNSQFTIYFTGTVMEEDCDGLCWQYIIKEEQIKPELVVITEPTNLNIYRGHRGRMEIMIHAKGLSCHGSAPERGDNAIYKISRIALEIEKLHQRLRSDPFLGKGSVTVTQVFFTSPSQCAVPDSASIQLDRRLTWGETKETALAEIAEACSLAGYPEAVIEVLNYNEPAFTGITYPTEKYYPAWVLPADSPWLVKASESYQQTLDRKPFIDKWTFSTNGVAISGMYGIPCLGLGPGNEVQAHAPNEACPITHLNEAAAFYAALVYRLNQDNE